MRITERKPPLAARAALSLLLFILSLLPWRLRRRLAPPLGRLMLALHPRRRHIIETNLRYCFPGLGEEERRRLLHAYAERLACTLLDFGWLWRSRRTQLAARVRIEGSEHVDAALRRGRPVMLLVPHTVALEHAGLALAARYPMIALAREGRGTLGGWALRRLRGRFCDCVLERGDPLLKVVRALKSGRVLYYLPDEDHGRRRRAVFVPYFGRKVCTVLGSGRLVALTRAQVLPCLATLDPATGSYRVSIEAPLRDLPYDDPVAICARLRAELERLIRRSPGDYLWNQRMFQTLEGGSRNPDYSLRRAREARMRGMAT